MIDKRVKGLNGGKKHFWLKEHRAEVMSYYHAHGSAGVLERFNMRPETLERFLVKRDIDIITKDKVTAGERALLIADIASERSLAATERVRIVEDWINKYDALMQGLEHLLAAIKRSGLYEYITDVETRNIRQSIDDKLKLDAGGGDVEAPTFLVSPNNTLKGRIIYVTSKQLDVITGLLKDVELAEPPANSNEASKMPPPHKGVLP